MGWHLPSTKTSSISTRHMSGVVQVGKRKTPLLPGDILKLAPADHEGPDPAYMVLLPTPAENRCVARCVILYDDGSLKPDFISEHSHLLRHAAPIDVPQHLTQRVLEVLDEHPTWAGFRDQKHDLFVSRAESKLATKYLAADSSASTKMLTDGK